MLQIEFIKDENSRITISNYLNEELNKVIPEILKDYIKNGENSKYFILYKAGDLPIADHNSFKTDLILLKERIEM